MPVPGDGEGLGLVSPIDGDVTGGIGVSLVPGDGEASVPGDGDGEGQELGPP